MKWLNFLTPASQDKTGNKVSADKQTVPERAETKTYITVFSLEPYSEFHIEKFLKGEFDKFFASEDHTVAKISSTLFNTQWFLYNNLDDLYEKTKVHVYGKIRNSVYILESPFTEDEVKDLAVKGLLSKIITRAYSYHAAFLEGGIKNERGTKVIVEDKVKAITNLHFQANLDVQKKIQPSNASFRLRGQA